MVEMEIMKIQRFDLSVNVSSDSFLAAPIKGKADEI